MKKDKELDERFRDIIRGPLPMVQTYRGCACNGYKFLCAENSELTSSNSGVAVLGNN